MRAMTEASAYWIAPYRRTKATRRVEPLESATCRSCSLSKLAEAIIYGMGRFITGVAAVREIPVSKPGPWSIAFHESSASSSKDRAPAPYLSTVTRPSDSSSGVIAKKP